MLTDGSFMLQDGDGRRNQNCVRILTRYEKSKYLAPTSKRITLNVSGVRFETYEETLNHFPETLLGCPEKRNEFYDDRTQEYVFARSKWAFDSILFYYQSHGILARPETVSVKDFDDELQFYQIHNPDPIAILLQGEENIDDTVENIDDTVGNSLRQRIWCVLEYPHRSRIGQLIAICSVFIIIFSIVIFCCETSDVLRHEQDKEVWFIMETICVTWFLSEYLIRVYSAPVRYKFIFSTMGIVDFLAILPYLVTLPFRERLEDVKSLLIMRALRLFRVIRVFKLSRYSVGFKVLLLTIVESLEQMRSICFCTGLSVLMFGSIIYLVEGPVGQFNSIPQSMWWAVQTMTSVGYGDIVPITPIGRFIGAFCAIAGILLFCLPAPILVTNFLKHYTRAFFSAPETLTENQRNLMENMKKIYLSSNR